MAYLIPSELFRNALLENYQSAAIRHLADTKLLKKNGSFDNAGHLVGFAGECAIKYRISTLETNPDNPKVHLPELIKAAQKRLQTVGQNSMFELLRTEILKGWNVNRRYYITGDVSEPELDVWISDVQRLFATAGLKGKK
jgi:hypothetical protein